MRAIAPLPGLICDVRHQPNADHHVQGVETCHGEVEGKEHLDLRRVRALKAEPWSRELMLLNDVAIVLNSLDSQESQPEQNRDAEQHDRALTQVELTGAHS